jgi:hypothetical protein
MMAMLFNATQPKPLQTIPQKAVSLWMPFHQFFLAKRQ